MTQEKLKAHIRQLAQDHFNEVVAIRRHIHQHPELSFKEFKTSAYVQELLRKYGIPFQTGFVKTGIVGKIEGKNAGKRVIALRADMDALPVTELNDIPFKSANHGVMHACGHDLHTASLLGTAKILHTIRDEFEGTILLVFQPGEEKIPGGAKLMLEEGALNDPAPELIIGQHGLPGLEAGKVGFRPGILMASSDEVYIAIKGKGGHAAIPHQLVDTVLIASHIIVALQQVISRNAPASIPSVLSFGKIDAPGATNVIPEEVKIEGTFRTMDEKWRTEAHQRITDMVRSMAEGMGATCTVDILKGYPVVVNHVESTLKAAEFSRQLLGTDHVVDIEMRMTSEDFAYYAQQFPAVFYRFGTTDPEGKFISPLHSPTHMADENALLTAMTNMAWLAVSFLSVA
jgi:amidohydrolase